MSEMRGQDGCRQVSRTKARSRTPEMDYGVSLRSRTQMEAPYVASAASSAVMLSPPGFDVSVGLLSIVPSGNLAA